MIALDHIALWTRNHYRSTYELSSETGLGSFDGGFLPIHGLAQKIVPLGGDVYLEVEGIVDYDVFSRGGWITEAIGRNTVDGDCFMGWCLRSDSLADLEALAEHHGSKPQHGIAGGLLTLTGAGDASGLILTPSVRDSWRIGKPNMYLEPELENHLASRPVLAGTGDTVGEGVAWIEIGESRAELADWLGPVFVAAEAAVEVRYNGGRSGLYGIGVNTSKGEQEIRRRPPV